MDKLPFSILIAEPEGPSWHEGGGTSGISQPDLVVAAVR